jgi:hypothetical protein
MRLAGSSKIAADTVAAAGKSLGSTCAAPSIHTEEFHQAQIPEQPLYGYPDSFLPRQEETRYL